MSDKTKELTRVDEYAIIFARMQKKLEKAILCVRMKDYDAEKRRIFRKYIERTVSLHKRLSSTDVEEIGIRVAKNNERIALLKAELKPLDEENARLQLVCPHRDLDDYVCITCGATVGSIHD